MDERTRRARLTGRPSERASSEKVDMQMKDGLSGTGADIENGPISMLNVPLAGNLRRH